MIKNMERVDCFTHIFNRIRFSNFPQIQDYWTLSPLPRPSRRVTNGVKIECLTRKNSQEKWSFIACINFTLFQFINIYCYWRMSGGRGRAGGRWIRPVLHRLAGTCNLIYGLWRCSSMVCYVSLHILCRRSSMILWCRSSIVCYVALQWFEMSSSKMYGIVFLWLVKGLFPPATSPSP